MDQVTLTDGDLVLRPWEPGDIDAVFEACQDPEVQRWTTIPSPYARSDAEWFVSTCADRWAAETASFAAVHAATNEIMGSFALEGCDTESGPEIGFWVHQNARGQGVAQRSVRRVCRWAFDDLGISRVVWHAYLGNFASRRVAESVGFVVEGIDRSGSVQRGVRRDGWRGSLLPTDLARSAAAGLIRASSLRGWPAEPVVLSSEQIMLRGYRPADAEAVWELAQDPVAGEWEPAKPRNIEDANELVRRRSDWSSGTSAAWVIASPDDTAVLGGISLFDVDAENLNAEVGYALLPNARGHGYATEALTLVGDWGLDTLGLQRISLFHAVENEASCGVATRATFELEGTLRRSYRYGDGQLHDEHLHARVCDDVDSSI